MESMVASLVIGNFFILTGFFVTIILMYRYSTIVSQQLNETKQKLQEQEKKIQSLQTTITSLDIISALTNPNLYYGSNYSSSTTKKPTTPKPSLSVLKSDNKSDEPQ